MILCYNRLPAAIPQVGYNSHYEVDGANYNASADYVIITDDVVLNQYIHRLNIQLHFMMEKLY